jgi:hypothetical protein
MRLGENVTMELVVIGVTGAPRTRRYDAVSP